MRARPADGKAYATVDFQFEIATPAASRSESAPIIVRDAVEGARAVMFAAPEPPAGEAVSAAEAAFGIIDAMNAHGGNAVEAAAQARAAFEAGGEGADNPEAAIWFAPADHAGMPIRFAFSADAPRHPGEAPGFAAAVLDAIAAELEHEEGGDRNAIAAAAERAREQAAFVRSVPPPPPPGRLPAWFGRGR